MTSESKPTDMSPDARFDELASILAAGVLRLRTSRNRSAERPEATSTNVLETGPNCLEVPRETVLSVPRG